ncbi:MULTISPECIES: hypothetical protein [unclassified Sulfitobacter]|uniref:hypothetical protein n=2 Tax=unclassified Caudoviricetes TaxID=2788787 RepID=UPI0002C099BA|nr:MULTISPECIES: hypothetical protein [unclassified Sulfitobacter]YP_007675417.1 hypothetical protein SUAG_00025 [Sulfitobacter phage pCB2047-A]AGH30751.1 hypothetical protein SUAG_00025 [Sulfitobacter phage pCB2047-A]PTA99598.1 hypothetical protein C8254_14325 [Sulfitobacter sp. CB-A]ULO21251.1 hypothetical protein IV89_001212 [Sulfitobacter sp. CB2047]
MSGTVNISRGIWHDTAFKPEPFSEREAFMWIIMEASYKPRQKRVGNVTVDLKRGQLATSVRFMCEAWDWSKSRVDRFLKRLEKRDMIGTDSGTGVNIITVCKYDDYQNKPKDSGTPRSEKRDSSGTAAGQQRDKPNKGLNPDAIPDATSSQEAEAYQRYLEAHPNPVDSDAGFARFSALVADGIEADRIIASAALYAETVKGWSAEAKVQQSDNFLCPNNGKWKNFHPKPKAVRSSEADILAHHAKVINGTGYVSPNAISATTARALIAAGLVTPEKLKERGIAA